MYLLAIVAWSEPASRTSKLRSDSACPPQNENVRVSAGLTSQTLPVNQISFSVPGASAVPVLPATLSGPAGERILLYDVP